MKVAERGPPMHRFARQNLLNGTTTTTEQATKDPTSTATPADSSKNTVSATDPISSSSAAESTTTASVPSLSLVAITTATAYTSSTHSPIPQYTGSGNVLKGYCATPDYTLIDGGPTAYWAPVLGCVGDKTDCCAFSVASMTAASTLQSTLQAKQVGGASVGFPIPRSDGAELDTCPDDYTSVGNGCCPSQYNPWNAAFDGQTPCYLELSGAAVMTPPPVPDTYALKATGSGGTSKPTSAVVNVVYAMQYKVKAPKNGGLALPSKIGIGAGAGIGALAFGILMIFLLWKRRDRKRNRAARQSLKNSGPNSTTDPVVGRYSAPSQVTSAGAPKWHQRVSEPVEGRFGEQFSDQGARPAGTKIYSADWAPGSVSPSPNEYSQKSMRVSPRNYSSTPMSNTPAAGLSVSGQQQYPFPAAVSPVDVPTELYGGVTMHRQELDEGPPIHRQGLVGVAENRQWPLPGARTRYDQ
ncbi:uncharacterized protein BDZ99DRAFT_567734 [Mytilinidion resinicola]|uniref:Uncharacterized protein n=1 Tax=Mytilinidion resinicola TaxID=574789 RepID=A0A6A6YZ65_9PEZI|nr:uncharacterized protein BDZ99DRAFT_567734 [Mytilinidion resinicola]KAF2814040.1 hypothetical protein BDZ99DRAFT_567734 [Mytilinidion resinicola]